MPIYADRFVSRRAGIDQQIAKSKIFADFRESEENDLFKQDPYGWRLKGYVNLLGSTLKSYKPESKILQLTEAHSDDIRFFNCTRNDYGEGKGWDCIPRKKPVIGQPYMIFDLPGYQETMQYDVLDWGSKNLLVASLKNQIHIWHSPSNNVLTIHDFENDVITATKWDPSGTYIAVGTLYGQFCIFDTFEKKIMYVPRARRCDNSSITALAWCPQGYRIACCTRTGMINEYDSRTWYLSASRKHAHTRDILSVQYSPDGQFLVTCGMDCMVRLWCLPGLVPLFEILYKNPARALAWHPWKRCQLAVGGGLGDGLGDGSLSVWDVARQTNLCHRLSSVQCAVDALAWSSHTGELAVSYWLDCLKLGNEEHIPGHCRVLVLSSLDKVTDEFCVPPGRTRALLFNPDGTKIASASSVEILYMWNFLGKPGPLLSMYRRKMKRQTSYHKLKEINEFNNFGIMIR